MCTVPVSSLITHGFVLGYDLSLAAPSVNSVLHPHYLIAKDTRLTVDEWVERGMHEVLNHVVGTRMPVWIILLLVLQLRERRLESLTQRLVDVVVRLDNRSTGVQSWDQIGLLEELSFGAQFFDTLTSC